MLKKERAAYIDQTLQALYPDPTIPLYHTDSYTLLVAVLLSAQCTDARVNTVTPALFTLANNPFAMAKVTVEDIRTIIRPCGLSPQKSKAISVLSQMLIDNHHGEVPDNFQELEALPGVGHKTASVVMSQAFGHPAFAVDTHIHRLAQRWGLTNGKNVQQTETDLKKLFAKPRWNHIHLQIIYYAREHCQARSCFGLECEICKTCYPHRKNKKQVLKP
jgi:endonuclease-3